ISDRFSVGAAGAFRSLSIGLDVMPSGTKEELINLDLDLTTADITVGTRFEVVRNRFVVAASSILISTESTGTRLSSPLLDGKGEKRVSRSEIPFKKTVLGVSFYAQRLS